MPAASPNRTSREEEEPDTAKAGLKAQAFAEG
jgi:hypothetical protein